MKIKRIGSELLWNYLRNPWNVNGSLDEICGDWKDGTSRKAAPPQKASGTQIKGHSAETLTKLDDSLRSA